MAYKTDKELFFEKMHLAGGMPLNEEMNLSDEANWAQDLDESKLGDMASAVFKTIKDKVNIPGWNTPEGQATRKTIIQKLDSGLSSLKSIIGSSMSDAEKVKQTQSLLNVPLISAAAIMILGFIKNTHRVAQEIPREGWYGDVIRLFGGEGIQTVHSMEYGGEVGLKLLIIALVLKVLHYVVSKGKLTTDVIAQQWNDVKSTYKENLAAVQNDQAQANDSALPSDTNISEEEPVDEVFGWSAKEKETKANQQKIEAAKQEVGKYNFNRIFFMPAQNADARNFKESKVVRINGIKQELPLLAELMPYLFDLNQGTSEVMMKSNPNEYQGYIPSNWTPYIFDRRTGYIDTAFAVENLTKEIDGLGQKMGLQMNELSGAPNVRTALEITKTFLLSGNDPLNNNKDRWNLTSLILKHTGGDVSQDEIQELIDDAMEELQESKKLKAKNLLFERMNKVAGMPLNEDYRYTDAEHDAYWGDEDIDEFQDWKVYKKNNELKLRSKHHGEFILDWGEILSDEEYQPMMDVLNQIPRGDFYSVLSLRKYNPELEQKIDGLVKNYLKNHEESIEWEYDEPDGEPPQGHSYWDTH